MPRTCRALALALYTTLGNVRDFASRSSQLERFYSLVGLSPSFKQVRYELVRFQRDHSKLLDYGRLRRLEKEVYRLAEEPRPDCAELLKAIVERESETIKAALVYEQKIIQFERELNRSTVTAGENNDFYENRFDSATADVSELAKELGLELPVL